MVEPVPKEVSYAFYYWIGRFPNDWSNASLGTKRRNQSHNIFSLNAVCSTAQILDLFQSLTTEESEIVMMASGQSMLIGGISNGHGEKIGGRYYSFVKSEQEHDERYDGSNDDLYNGPYAAKFQGRKRSSGHS